MRSVTCTLDPPFQNPRSATATPNFHSHANLFPLAASSCLLHICCTTVVTVGSLHVTLLQLETIFAIPFPTPHLLQSLYTIIYRCGQTSPLPHTAAFSSTSHLTKLYHMPCLHPEMPCMSPSFLSSSAHTPIRINIWSAHLLSDLNPPLASPLQQMCPASLKAASPTPYPHNFPWEFLYKCSLSGSPPL